MDHRFFFAKKDKNAEYYIDIRNGKCYISFKSLKWGRSVKTIIAKRGLSDYSVVIPNDAHVVEKTAAKEVSEYIEKALSVKLPTVAEKDFVGKGIFIGHTDFAKENAKTGKSKENWIIAMCGDNLILTGGVDAGDRGIIYAAYHFLEDIVGVRWWNPYEEDVPELSELALPKDFCCEKTPVFAYRKPFMQNVSDVGFAHLARCRVNVISPFDDGIEKGRFDENVRKYGDVREAGRPHHSHTFHKLFPAEEYFDEHPDWWAWNEVRGKRMKIGQNCLTNEEFIDAFVKKICAFAEEDIELSKKTGVELPCSYALEPNDLKDYAYCQCEKCRKIIEKSGLSGYIVQFVNRVVREVNKVYPEVRCLFSPYMSTIKPPKDDTLPDKNVIIRIANIYEDICRGISAPSNGFYREILAGWAERCRKSGSELRTWEYVYSLITTQPLPFFYGMKDKTQILRDAGASGLFAETENPLADSWDFNNFMLCHLLEDPDLDDAAMINDFISRYYGPAAEHVKSYYELLKAAMDEHMFTVYCCMEHSPFNYVDVRVATEGSRLLALAQSAVSGKAPFEGRVMILRKPLDVSILFKYFELKKAAESEVVPFDFDREEMKARIVAALSDYASKKGNEKYPNIAQELEYFKNFLIEDEQVWDIPEELSDVPEEDIFQFSLKDMMMFSSLPVVTAYGSDMVCDEDAGGRRVLKMSYDKGTDPCWEYERTATSKFAEFSRPLHFLIQKNDETVDFCELYLEDMKKGGFHLYKIGSVDGLSKCRSAKVGLFSDDNICISLCGIRVLFPMDACDVYISIKFTGEVYGGDKNDENAISFARLIVVRK